MSKSKILVLLSVTTCLFLAAAIMLANWMSGFVYSSEADLIRSFPRFHRLVYFIAYHHSILEATAGIAMSLLLVLMLVRFTALPQFAKTTYAKIKACIKRQKLSDWYAKAEPSITNRNVIFAIGFLILFYTVWGIGVPTAIGMDSFDGFRAMKATFEKGMFNQVIEPNPENIAEDTSYFLTYWTPGQYIFPALFYYLGLPLGTAITIVVLLFSVAGVIGYYYLYRLLQFNQMVSVISLFIIVTQMSFIVPFMQYAGGEVLLFGISPWIVWFVLKNRSLPVWSLPVMLLLFLFGFLAKNAFLIFFFPLMLTVGVLKLNPDKNYLRQPIMLLKQVVQQIGFFLKLGLLSAAFLALVYFGFMQFGSNTITDYEGWNGIYWGDIIFPLALPLTACFSVDIFLDSITGVRLHDGLKTLLPTAVVYIPLACVAIWLTNKLVRKSTNRIYSLLVLFFFLFHVVFFMYAYLMNTQTPMQSRNAVLMGFLFLPGIVNSIFGEQAGRKHRATVFFAVLSNFFFSLLFMFQFQFFFKTKLGVGADRIVYEYVDSETLLLLRQFDDSLLTGNNIFYLPTIEATMDVKHNRAIANQDFFRRLELEEVVQTALHYSGRVDNLIILMPKEFTTRDKGVLKLFTDYKEFEQIAETETYRFLKGK